MSPLDRFKRDKLNDARGKFFVSQGKRYELGGLIGDGAIGVVRKAKPVGSEEQLAVKFLSPEVRYIDQSSFEDIHARFKREGMRGTHLDHYNLVKVVAYEENEGGSCFEEASGPANPFIIMELIKGGTLEDFIRGQTTKKTFHLTKQTFHIAKEIVEGVAFLHTKNIVHRDVKPANIFVSKCSGDEIPKKVKIGDFGVVKWGDFKASVATGTLTMTGQQGLGTFKYMSPEQAISPKEVSVRSDMYSLGVTLYELFTNQILQSPHHVFQITRVRLQRGSVGGKLIELGLGNIPHDFEGIFSDILDMFLTGVNGRPSSAKFLGKLKVLYERHFEDDE